jgi:hypothetical protein
MVHQVPRRQFFSRGAEVGIPEGPVAGAPDLEAQVTRGRTKLRKRTAALSRESIAAVFELWRVEFERERSADGPPLLASGEPSTYGDDCAQSFLRLAVQLWPNDEALRALRDEEPARLATSPPPESRAVAEDVKPKGVMQWLKSKFA